MRNTSKNDRYDDKRDDQDDNSAQSAGFLGGITGAVKGATDASDAAQSAKNPGIVGSVEDLVRGVTDASDAARREANRDKGIVGSMNDAVTGVTEANEAARRAAEDRNKGIFDRVADAGKAASDAARDAQGGGGSTGGGAGKKKWRGEMEQGVTWDAQGRRVNPDGSLADSIVGGAQDAVDAAQRASDLAEDNGEWTSLSGSEGAVGSEEYMERLRKAHEAAGTEYQSDRANTDDKRNPA